ncbi:MAG: hypothetical protein M1378_10980 [Bacteroidetes bacterium]|nr:hypothetical protein [Bacteroidota bacterium]
MRRGVYGTINFYSSEPGFFDQQEMTLLEELSSDIAYSVENIEREEQRKSLRAQLIQAQKLESLGTLAGGIAHDFNNILGIIMGYSQLLQREKPAVGDVSRSADAIQKAAACGAGLVKQLLTFARKEESAYEHVQLNDIVNEVARLLKETLPKTIVVSTELDSELPYLDADATQIHQVLLNLCVNSRDAMPNGGTLEIVTEAVVESEGYSLIAARDGEEGAHFSRACEMKSMLSSPTWACPRLPVTRCWKEYRSREYFYHLRESGCEPMPDGLQPPGLSATRTSLRGIKDAESIYFTKEHS